MKYLLVIPGFMIGGVFGCVFLALLPALIISTFWSDLIDIMAVLEKPAVLIGGAFGVFVVVVGLQ